jgi:hypothetical protein
MYEQVHSYIYINDNIILYIIMFTNDEFCLLYIFFVIQK